MTPFPGAPVVNVITRVRGVGLAAGLLANEELKGLVGVPGPKHVRMPPFALAPKAAEHDVGIGLGDLRVQLGRCIPDREDGAAFLGAVVLDAAIAAGWFSGMPIGPAIVNGGMGCQHRDLTVETGGISLAFEVPPQMLGGRRGAEQGGSSQGKKMGFQGQLYWMGL